MYKKTKPLIKILFRIYILILFITVIIKFKGSFYNLVDRRESIKLSREMGAWNLNLVPFRTIKSYWRNRSNLYALKNILGNILVFIPFGFFLPIEYNKKFKEVIIISFVSVLLIETFQLITMLGYFDIDDIILNITGCILGYGIYKKFYLNKNSQIKS